LLWVACYDSTPTLYILNHQNLFPKSIYPQCSSYDKSFLFCIIDRTTSKNIHHSLGFKYVEFFNNVDPRDSLTIDLTLPTYNIFAVVVWWSLRYINSTCFSSASIPTYRLAMESINLSSAITYCFHHALATTIHDRHFM